VENQATSDVDLVLLTRFNLPSEGPESLIRAEEGWLADRWGLFERYTVPSVRAQTDHDVHWIIYLDPQSPAWLIEHMTLLADEGLVTPIYRERVLPPELAADIAATVGEAHGTLLATANLDNDDGLSPDFVARLKDAAGPGRQAVYFEVGLIRSPTRLYLRHDPVNAFVAVTEPWDGAVTCWVDWHNLLSDHMPVRVVAGAPAWLQVVHGRNVSNRALGDLVDPAIYRDAFPGCLDDLVTPTTTTLLVEQYVVRPGRAVKEGVRAGVKAIFMRLFGKDGWTKVKHAWKRLTSRFS